MADEPLPTPDAPLGASFRRDFDAAQTPLAAARALQVLVRDTAGSSTVDGNLSVSGNTTLGNAAADTVVMNAKSITSPNRPMVLAYNSASDLNQTGAGATATVDFDTEIMDRGGDFSADTFTAPITGGYSVGGAVAMSGFATPNAIFVAVVTSNRTYGACNVSGIGGSIRAPYSVPLADMDAGDTLAIQVTVTGEAGNTITIAGSAAPLITFVAIHLVG